MSEALAKLLNEGSTPTPGAPAPRAKPNPNLLDRASGDVANARSFRDAQAAEAAAEKQHVQLDPEQVAVADVPEMLRIIDEEMAKMLPPENVRESWTSRVDSGEFRTWMLPKHKAARFMIGHIVGNVAVSIFRQHVQNAVMGEAGGSLFATVRNQQFTGRWEPFDYHVRSDIMGGGVVFDVEQGKVLGQMPGTKQLFLTVQFIDISGKPAIVYDAKGLPNTDFAAGGPAMAEMVKLVKEMRANADKSEERAAVAEADVAKAENAELRAKMDRMEALLATLTTPASAPPSAPAAPEEPKPRSAAQLAHDARLAESNKSRAKPDGE
jgi:hypothetical protein